MKLNFKDININWNVYPNIPSFLENNFDLMSNVTFNVKILDENLILINEKNNIPSAKIDKAESYNLFYNIKNLPFAHAEPIPMELLFSNPKRTLESDYFNQNIKQIIVQNFIYLFEENANDYYLKYQKNGFFKKLNFFVDYNTSDARQNINVEYKTINMQETPMGDIFTKIFKSEDNIALKFKINFEEFKKTDITSLFIIPYAHEGESKTQLKEMYISNIQNKWLNNSDNTKLLTIPFEDNFSVIQDILSLEIIPLNNVQTEIIEFFKSKLSRSDLLDLIKEFFIDQLYKTNLIYGESLLNKIAGFYQGYLYLFNNESWSSISWPQTEQSLLGIKYAKYFPLALKDNIETTSSEKEMQIESSVLEIHENDIQDNLLGYKIDNSFKDVKDDGIYFKSNNIRSVSILNIEELENKTKIYLEFVTNFDLLSNVYIDSISNGLSFIQKYYKNINDQNYATLLFCYEYNNDSINNDSETKSHTIQGKKLINFNIRLY
jgi:hypothetical protein